MARLVGLDSDVELQLEEGETILGRGPLLKVVDKRVSRNHAVMQWKDGHLSLCPKHSNPCFVRSCGGTEFNSIVKNQQIPLSDGDILSLLPDSLRYRINIERREREEANRLEECENSATSTKKGSTGRKRMLPSWMTSSSSATTLSSGHTAAAKKRKKQPAASAPSSVPPPSPPSSHPSPVPSPSIPSSSPVPTTSLVQQSSPPQSIPKQTSLLPPCQYGTSCYRKNPAHFREYSHNIPSDDDRPECPYGTACYRKNPDHRRQFSHTSPPADQPQPNTTKQDKTRPKRTNKKRVSVLTGDSDDSDAPNTYDYNDSFIDDEHLSSESTSYGGESEDSDWAPPQVTATDQNEEEEESVGDLVDEAKDFILNKKMWQQ